MADLRCCRDVILTRPARYASLLAVVLLVTALAAAGSLASSHGARHTASASAKGSQNQTGEKRLDTSRGAETAALGTIETSGSDTGDAPATARVRTMSMDAPIQGGLTAHQEQAQSARILHRHQTPSTAPAGAYWTPAMGRTAVARAESWLGMPYSWAGGNAAGPTPGRCDADNGGDLDCHVVGFDCSGLVMYAWGTYASLPHLAQAQQAAGGFHPAVSQLRPGDLVFFAGYLPGGTGHVAVYAGHGTVIEAPQSGSLVRRSSLRAIMASDGYRGAVRPLTGKTPTIAASRLALPATGGLVTLHGTNLTNAGAVRLGGAVVRHFVRQTDSVLSFRAPGHPAGPVPLSLSTPWGAASASMPVTYAKARPVEIRTSPSPSPRPTHQAPTHQAPTHQAPTLTSPTTHPAPTRTPTTTPTKPTSKPTSSRSSSGKLPVIGSLASTSPGSSGT